MASCIQHGEWEPSFFACPKCFKDGDVRQPLDVRGRGGDVGATNTQMTYIAMAYRWGWTNAHNYVIYAGQDGVKAIALAQTENQDRGGKYGCVVWKYSDTPEKQNICIDLPEPEQVAYFPSLYDEKRVHHNYRIDMFNALGHAFYDYAEGIAWIAHDDKEIKDRKGNPLKLLKQRKVKPPAWVVEKRNAEEKMAKFMERAVAKTRRKKSK